MALDSIRSHKFRSFLTILGIVVGVMTAIVVASILTGMRQNIVAIVEDYGTNNIYAFHLSTGFRRQRPRRTQPQTADRRRRQRDLGAVAARSRTSHSSPPASEISAPKASTTT